MPGQHSDEERERKERIKKLKAKTSKMRLAIVKKKSIGILPRKGGGISELSERVTNRRIEKDYAKGKGMPKGKEEEYAENMYMSPNRPDTKDPPAAMYLDKDVAKRLAMKKKKKKEYDQDGENEHNRDNYNAQSSVETGGDY